MGGYLTEADADRMLRDAEDFGRRQPMAVLGIGLAVGFVASRFLKASSQRRYQGRSEPVGYEAERSRAKPTPDPVATGGPHGV